MSSSSSSPSSKPSVVLPFIAKIIDAALPPAPAVRTHLCRLLDDVQVLLLLDPSKIATLANWSTHWRQQACAVLPHPDQRAAELRQLLLLIKARKLPLVSHMMQSLLRSLQDRQYHRLLLARLGQLTPDQVALVDDLLARFEQINRDQQQQRRA
jgi:hypothetical protein